MLRLKNNWKTPHSMGNLSTTLALYNYYLISYTYNLVQFQVLQSSFLIIMNWYIISHIIISAVNMILLQIIFSTIFIWLELLSKFIIASQIEIACGLMRLTLFSSFFCPKICIMTYFVEVRCVSREVWPRLGLITIQ